jgi:hypothetical protein
MYTKPKPSLTLEGFELSPTGYHKDVHHQDVMKWLHETCEDSFL